MKCFRTPLALIMVVLAASTSTQAQVRRGNSPAASATSAADISLRVGQRTYEFKGPAECKAAPQASIYGTPAALFTITQPGGADTMRLSVWQPRRGGQEMFNLTARIAGKAYEIDTVKGGDKRDTKGSGHASVRATGNAATIVIDAVASDGTSIKGVVSCEPLRGIVAEGG